MKSAAQWASLGKEPIQAASAAGKDVRQDPAFDELQSEVQKAVSVIGGAAADWEKVVQLAGAILASTSKDILVAGYFAVGLIHTRGLEGFETGSGVYRDLLQTYWEDLFPVKTRPLGRSRAIAWWVEKTAAVLQTLEPAALSKKQLETLRGQYEAFQEFLNAHLEDGVSLAPITDWLRIATARANAGVEAPQAAAPAPPASVASPTPQGILSDAQVNQTFDRIAQEARALASYFSASDAANAAIYRLNRLALWISVDEMPPAHEGRTLLAPPERRLMEYLASLASRGDYDTLLKAAEDETARFIFWLDLHRYCAEALHALGERFKNADETVGLETAAFAARLPGLEGLAFSDGTPFADAATRRWLRDISRAPQPQAQPAATLETDPALAGMDDVKRLLRSRKIADAALLFQTHLRAALSARAKLLYRLDFVDALTHSAGENVALPQVEQILEDIDLYRLGDFEPALALRGITAALKACRAQADPGAKKKVGELLHRLAKLDLAEFFKQGG